MRRGGRPYSTTRFEVSKNSMVTALKFLLQDRKGLGKLRELLQEQSGNSALEYVLVLTLLGLGATSILGVSATFSNGIMQKLISTATAVWPT